MTNPLKKYFMKCAMGSRVTTNGKKLSSFFLIRTVPSLLKRIILIWYFSILIERIALRFWIHIDFLFMFEEDNFCLSGGTWRRVGVENNGYFYFEWEFLISTNGRPSKYFLSDLLDVMWEESWPKINTLNKMFFFE